MQHPDFKYVDYAIGGLKRRNNVAIIGSLTLPENPVDCYKTYFRYGESYREHWIGNNRSVSQYVGPCYADFVPIDIDSADPAQSQKVARDFLLWLESQTALSIDSVGVYFSGEKGFHIEIPTALLGDVEPSRDLPQRFKRFIRAFGNWPFDMKIYQVNRLWRITNTIHSGSGLFKVRLSVIDLYSLSIAEIKEQATSPNL